MLVQTVIDRKFEPLIKKLMTKYLGEMEEEDLILFVLEHLKDHKPPHKLVEGLEPVRLFHHSVFSFQLADITWPLPFRTGFVFLAHPRYACLLTTLLALTGPGRRSTRIRRQPVETSHFRGYGVQRWYPYGEDACGRVGAVPSQFGRSVAFNLFVKLVISQWSSSPIYVKQPCKVGSTGRKPKSKPKLARCVGSLCSPVDAGAFAWCRTFLLRLPAEDQRALAVWSLEEAAGWLDCWG